VKNPPRLRPDLAGVNHNISIIAKRGD